jgi:hypothetical protein
MDIHRMAKHRRMKTKFAFTPIFKNSLLLLAIVKTWTPKISLG